MLFLKWRIPDILAGAGNRNFSVRATGGPAPPMRRRPAHNRELTGIVINAFRAIPRLRRRDHAIGDNNELGLRDYRRAHPRLGHDHAPGVHRAGT